MTGITTTSDLSALAKRAVVTGDELMTALRTHENNPYPKSKDTVIALIGKAEATLTSEQLRKIVDFAIRGIEHHVKLGDRDDALDFFHIASYAVTTLRSRGEGYNALAESAGGISKPRQ